MAKHYPNRINWENTPSKKTPISAENLNKMDKALYEMDGELDKNSTDIDVLSARMDTFSSLPEGSTSGNAELVDIRVGADGKTYSTAGNSVREQFAKVYEDIDVYTAEGNSLDLVTAKGGMRLNGIKGKTEKVENVLTSSASLGLVDLGDLRWTFDSETKRFYTSFPKAKVNAYTEVSSIVVNRNYIPVSESRSNAVDKSICIASSNMILIKDTSYDNPTDFKNANKGTLLAYEVADGQTADKYALVVEENGKNAVDINKVYSNSAFTIRGNEVEGHLNRFAWDGRFNIPKPLLNKPCTISCYIKSKDGREINPRFQGMINGVQALSTPKKAYGDFVQIQYTFTPITENDYMSISYTGSIIGEIVIVKDLQLECGDTVTSYTPYTHNTIIFPVTAPLRSVNDVKDEIVKVDGVWKVVRRIGGNETSGLTVLTAPIYEEIPQNPCYSLEAYNERTYVTTYEGLANLSVDYGKSGMVSTALNTERLLLAKEYGKSAKKYILIGDSYGEGYSVGASGGFTYAEGGWCKRYKVLMGLSNDDCYIGAEGGAGFCNDSHLGNNFLNILTNLATNEGYKKEEITDIILMGGFNDQTYPVEQIKSAMTTFVTYVENNYPNARLHIGFDGWHTGADPNFTHIDNIVRAYNTYNSFVMNNKDIHWLKNIEYIAHDPANMSLDYFHPNDKGYNELAQGLVKALEDDLNVMTDWYTMALTPVDSTYTISGGLKTSLHNDTTRIGGIVTFDFAGKSFELNNQFVGIAFVKNSLVIGCEQGNVFTTISADCLIKFADNTYRNESGVVGFNNCGMYFSIPIVNDNGIGWKTGNISTIEFMLHATTIPSMLQ